MSELQAPGTPSGCESQKKVQLMATLQWVDENYEWSNGICVPRCVLYQHYQDFCKRMAYVCVGPATFGKIIRQRFPKLTTRRLGTRGQSRYHYYGIGIKENSQYYKQAYTGKRLSRFSGVQIKTEGSTKRYSLTAKTSALLPEFPQFEDLILEENTDRNKARTFLVMYRTHCQRILDTVVSANFSEVQKFFSHFWQGMPEHLLDSLKSVVLARVVAACDAILYKIMNDVLIPSTIQEMPKSLYKDIKSFIKNFSTWMEAALKGCPETLITKKMEVASWFVVSMKKQLSFIKLAQTTRSLLNNSEATRQMGQDLAAIDMTSIAAQVAVVLRVSNFGCINKINEYYRQLVSLLLKQSPLEDFMEWIDDVIENCLTEIGDDIPLFSDVPVIRYSSSGHFVLVWSYLISLITRDLTLQNSTSFGSVHVVHLMFNEYVYLVIETQKIRLMSQKLQKDVERCLKPGCKFSSATFGLESESTGVNRNVESKGVVVGHHPPVNYDMSNRSECCWEQNTTSTMSNDSFEFPQNNRRTIHDNSTGIIAHEKAIANEMCSRIEPGTSAPCMQFQPYGAYFESDTSCYYPCGNIDAMPQCSNTQPSHNFGPEGLQGPLLYPMQKHVQTGQ